MSILLVEKNDQGLQAAVMHRGKLYAYCGESGALSEGQVFSAVADRVAKGISAVFLRLPEKQTGFLPLSAQEKAPASGQRLIVQVKRPPTASKKALLTTDIALAGDALVYLPQGRGVHVSSRIDQENVKASLLAMGKQLNYLDGGVILRSAAVNRDLAALQKELDTLRSRWQSIQAAAQQSAPRLLWDGEDSISLLLREERSRLEYVLTNAPESLPEDLPCPVKTCEHPFLLHTVQHWLERSLRRTVQLKSGATLVIDPCEAMTVIDVNSAQAAVGKDIGETAEKINQEAAWEIARLLRLRGIGGMIVVDFIDLPTEAARQRLLSVMREALLEDPVKTTVHDITALGLMELTRHRGQVPLSPLPDLPCPHCGGSGIELNPVEEDPIDA